MKLPGLHVWFWAFAAVFCTGCDIGGSRRPYMVVDLVKWSVRYLDEAPDEGWTDEYRTTKIVLRRIEAGSFSMGSPGDEPGRFRDEYHHRVTLTRPFYIGVFEVTQAQWKRVMGRNPSTFRSARRPVEGVGYDDICGSDSGAEWPASSRVDEDSFLGRLRERTLKEGFDLPTEAQWEYACRAGTETALPNEREFREKGKPCVFALDDIAWHKGNCWADFELENGVSCAVLTEKYNLVRKGGTHVVGLKQPNAWGLYDMIGNVWEWCRDWGGRYRGDATDPKGPESGSSRVYRGGSWGNDAISCRSAFRFSFRPDFRCANVGFRLYHPAK